MINVGAGAESGCVSANKKAWNCVFEARLYKLAVVFDEIYSFQVFLRKGKSCCFGFCFFVFKLNFVFLRAI